MDRRSTCVHACTWKVDKPFLSWIWLIIKPNRMIGTGVYCKQPPPDNRSLSVLIGMAPNLCCKDTGIHSNDQVMKLV